MLLAVCTLLMGQLSPAGADLPPVPGPIVRVVDVLDVPTFVVGDAPFTTPCFETYVPEQRYFEQFAAAGTRLFSFNTNVAACDYGHSKPTWLGPDEWDYSDFDERMQRVLAAKPDALVIPRVNLGTPRWWLDVHPEALEILHTGSPLYTDPNRNPTLPKGRPFPSVASPEWRRDIGMALERFLDHIHNAPYAGHIFGYFLAGLDTEEWYPWSSGSDELSGYSPPTQAAFRAWLRAKYGTDEALQASWSDRSVTLDSAVVPPFEARYDTTSGALRNPATKMPVIDFYQFYNEIIPETIDYFAAIVKRKTAGTKVVGAFYGYMYEFRGDPEYGHNALSKYVRSPNLDFMFVTASYGNRDFGRGGDYTRSPAYTLQLHDKLWYHDNDVISFRAPEVMRARGMHESATWSQDTRHHMKVLGYTDTPEKSQWMYRRSMGFALCQGAFESFFDLHGGYYDDPKLLEEVSRLNRVAEVAKRYYRRSCSEILVVSDEVSCAYATFRSPLLETNLLNPQISLVKMGAPADHILVDDLPLIDATQYKMVIFLNCYHLTADSRALIEEKLKRDGKLLVWCYAAGLFDGNHQSLDTMNALMGMTVGPDSSNRDGKHQILITADALGARGDTVGPATALGETFVVNDPDSTAWGVIPNTDQVVLAEKALSGWSSVYTVTADLPPGIYRALAKRAGVHIFNDRDDTLYANESFVTLHADGAGERVVTFPWACDVVDMITEEPVAVNTDTYRHDFQDGETMILRWKTRL